MFEWPHANPMPGWTTPQEAFICVESSDQGVLVCAGEGQREVHVPLTLSQAKHLLQVLSDVIRRKEEAE